jgi:hypothetical protein
MALKLGAPEDYMRLLQEHADLVIIHSLIGNHWTFRIYSRISISYYILS